ncbi:hypothetical protein CEUSTIGMA_g1176.t1 [Chlamydomonas eustigma]|uniref:Uncharacterized protein n=1 Tax=Chlamydomonas eustigma TaxID=1157962 RepID=A0A250WSB2_9CHLO|nr:hypothetical protein CEUSTIGMA_g1176.t1 [Chlamydomonas eustigma]|eukprot:GAX73723.1 hypothetical protein CEUSTIGMA_g1176.t1 [Chlamydomonas eustigma]
MVTSSIQSCVDFLIDSSLTPWLLEANATPSMKVEHADPSVEKMIHDQKWPVIQDMVRVLGICAERFKPSRSEWQDLSFLHREMESLGGFSPLMHLFPEETAEGLRTIPWGPLDIKIRSFIKAKSYKSTLLGH